MPIICQHVICVIKLPKHSTEVQMLTAKFMYREISSVNRADKVKETPVDFIVTELKHPIYT